MTKKELMIKAHKMAREIKNEYPAVDYKFQLGLCLTYLYQGGGKEMVELKGTEKQVAWANEIRENIVNHIETMKEKAGLHGQRIADALGEDFPKAVRRDEAVKKLRADKGNAYLNKVLEIIKNEEKATKIIDARDFTIDTITDILRNGRI